MAERVFGDDEARKWLEEMLWPRVGQRMLAWKAEVDASIRRRRAAVVEVPLLFESGMEEAFDAHDRGRRRRGGAGAPGGRAGPCGGGLAGGPPAVQEEKAERAEFVVRNDGTLDELREALSRVLGTHRSDLSSIPARSSARPPQPRHRAHAGAGCAWPSRAGAWSSASAVGRCALGPLRDAIREVTLPLRHEDIIRQQAADKGVDAALIAAVIYEESKFRDQTSHAGARGLMQITPRDRGLHRPPLRRHRFEQGDLGTPQINIAYGT